MSNHKALIETFWWWSQFSPSIGMNVLGDLERSFDLEWVEV